ncbi:hypothetical protein FQA39_LY15831 [Lamprigera yunnana]|nr:hypothetical protein FQA39_LY15831 [Lamprigera yunnana]
MGLELNSVCKGNLSTVFILKSESKSGSNGMVGLVRNGFKRNSNDQKLLEETVKVDSKKSINVLGLIRHYSMLLKKRDLDDSGNESQPLMSSESSAVSYGAINMYVYNDSDTTDYEVEGTKTGPGFGHPSSKPFVRQQLSFPGYGCEKDFFYEKVNGHPFGYYPRMNGLLQASDSSMINGKGLSSFDDIELPKTQNSLITIFAIWNTIMGTSLLAMPWGMERAGLFPGIFLNITVAGLCLYTCYLILRINEDHGNDGRDNGVCDLARILLGRWAEIIARIFSLVVLLGSNIVYWVLMSNFLYNSVRFIYGYATSLNDLPISNTTVICPKQMINQTFDNLDMEMTQFDKAWDLYSTVPVVLAVLMFPLLNFKCATFFTKFNSLGTFSVMYVLVFVYVKSYDWGINMTSWLDEFGAKSSFCALSGMLSLSYFIHNIIIAIMRNNRNQENNNRDLSIAFALVTFTYTSIGIIFYVCFPLAKSCIEDVKHLEQFRKTRHNGDDSPVAAALPVIYRLSVNLIYAAHGRLEKH